VPAKHEQSPGHTLCEHKTLISDVLPLQVKGVPVSRRLTRFSSVTDVRVLMIKDAPRPSPECHASANARAEGKLRFFIDGHDSEGTSRGAGCFRKRDQDSGKFSFESHGLGARDLA
jgi:hypothetical protein